ncbi:MAG: sensor histidine kinase [Phycisphaerales bacterium]|nr:sensor histidine kinase [Phycisphaerales bacterium]
MNVPEDGARPPNGGGGGDKEQNDARQRGQRHPGVVRVSALTGSLKHSAVSKSDPACVADRLTGLVHELSNLLDASLRQVSLAGSDLGAIVSDVSRVGDVQRRLGIVRAALEQMSQALSSAAAAGSAMSTTRSRLGIGEAPGSMSEAVHFASAIMEPMATENSVRLEVHLDEALDTAAPMCVYSVVVNAVRNAVEAIALQRRAMSGGGTKMAGSRVMVEGKIEQTGAGPRVVLRVVDDGPGLGLKRGLGAQGVRGVSTKPGHLGIGLALVRELVEKCRGTLELFDNEGAGARGACLRVTLPVERIAPGTGLNAAEEGSKRTMGERGAGA